MNAELNQMANDFSGLGDPSDFLIQEYSIAYKIEWKICSNPQFCIEKNFPVKWDTTKLENGQYEVMGLMHVFVKKGREEKGIARQNVVEVTVKNRTTKS